MPTKIPEREVQERVQQLRQEIDTYERLEKEVGVAKATELMGYNLDQLNEHLAEEERREIMERLENKEKQKNPLPLQMKKKRIEEKSQKYDSESSCSSIGSHIDFPPKKIPKKRGPKKKAITPARVAKYKLRRINANDRERNRMHSLNDWLEILRLSIPGFTSGQQKLSKIETLRITANYIQSLRTLLENDTITTNDTETFVETMCKGLSQNTTNLLSAALGCRLMNNSPENSDCNSTFYNSVDMEHSVKAISIPGRVRTPLDYLALKSTGADISTMLYGQTPSISSVASSIESSSELSDTMKSEQIEGNENRNKRSISNEMTELDFKRIRINSQIQNNETCQQLTIPSMISYDHQYGAHDGTDENHNDRDEMFKDFFGVSERNPSDSTSAQSAPVDTQSPLECVSNVESYFIPNNFQQFEQFPFFQQHSKSFICQ
ncbi:hypothetical protein SNEBB_009867 [Seison nebaliae]|nr:hypothetical protein SNEBB_009867 [Seison nebaliae]